MADAEPLGEVIGTERDAAMAEHFTPVGGADREPRRPRKPLTTDVSDFLRERRDQHQGKNEIGITLALGDILGLVRAERSDLLGSPQAEEQKKPLTDMLDDVAGVMMRRSGKKDAEADNRTLREVGSYLIEKIEDDRAHGGVHQNILWKYLEAIPKELRPEAYRKRENKKAEPEESNVVVEVASPRTEAKEEKEGENEQAQLPEYHYSPGEHLETFFAENEDKPVTIKTLNEFGTAQRDDLQNQSERFETEHRELIAAIDAADTFSIAHKEERESGGLIVVVEDEGDPIVGWEKDMPALIGTTFRFDPREFSDSPLALGQYVYSRNQFNYRLDGIPERNAEGANQAVKRLIILASQPDAKITPKEAEPIYLLIKQHEDLIEAGFKAMYHRHTPPGGISEEGLQEVIMNDPDSAREVASLLNQLNMMQSFRTLLDEREKSTVPGRRLFTSAGKALRSLRKKTNE